VDLSSRLRAIVRPRDDRGSEPGSGRPPKELTYEPDSQGYTATVDVRRMGEVLGGRPVSTAFGECLVIDRRYEADRWHGDVQIGDCELRGIDDLSLLDPALATPSDPDADKRAGAATPPDSSGRTLFIDLETTGISGGAGTVAFLVGLGYFDVGAFQMKQFLLTSFAAERALLAAVSDLFDETDLIVTYNGKTFDVPVMETRWIFHRMELPLEGVPHFDMLHPARRLWKLRSSLDDERGEGGCRLGTLERMLFDVRRVGDVPGFEIPGRFFTFLRSGDPRPLEPILEHNRLDLVSLAAVTARAVRLAQHGVEACRDAPEALALGRVYERAGNLPRAESCYRAAAASGEPIVRAEALYRVGLRCRRERRFHEAADAWQALFALTSTATARYEPTFDALRQFAAEALAIHQEHRARDFSAARELAMFAMDELRETSGRRSDGMRHRLARLERKIAKRNEAPLFWG
jgi:uncharacterized protein YprB with RNaseH-like and TPR domain